MCAMRAREFRNTKDQGSYTRSAFNSKFNNINSYFIFTSKLQYSYYDNKFLYQAVINTKHAGKEFYVRVQ